MDGNEVAPNPEESFWAGAKYDFVHSGMSIRRIAAKYVVSEGTLRHRIKAWGWVRKVPTQRMKGGPALKRPEPCYGTGANAEALYRKRILARLFRVLDHKMKLLDGERSPRGRRAAKRRRYRARRSLVRFVDADLCQAGGA